MNNKPNTGLIVGGVAAALVVIGLAVFFILRSTGAIGGTDPATVVSNYYSDVFTHLDAQSAYNLECATYQSQTAGSLSALQEIVTSLRTLGAAGGININGLTYTTTDQSSSIAHVRVAGSVGLSFSGTSTTSPANSIVTLDKSGSGWCIAGGFSLSGSSTSNRFPVASPFAAHR